MLNSVKNNNCVNKLMSSTTNMLRS